MTKRKPKRSKKQQDFWNLVVDVKAQRLRESPSSDNMALFLLASMMANAQNDAEGIQTIRESTHES